jgi:hypothetical protein
MTSHHPEHADAHLLGALSAARTRPYLDASAGCVHTAVRLYRWNVDLSGAVYETLHVVEVVLRNALDRRLRQWNAKQVPRSGGAPHAPEWLLDPAHLIRRLLGADLETATRRALVAVRRSAHPRRDVAHEDVVAQLGLGTWRYLLPPRNERKDPGKQRLWDDALAGAFPHAARPASAIVDDVAALHALRNRVAHLEPLLRAGHVERTVQAARRVLADIDPVVEQWWVGGQRVTAVLARRPSRP